MRFEHTYEILVSGDQVVGKVWWDTENKKLDGDNTALLTYLKKQHYGDITYHEGVRFLEHLGNILNNGYIHARKVDY